MSVPIVPHEQIMQIIADNERAQAAARRAFRAEVDRLFEAATGRIASETPAEAVEVRLQSAERALRYWSLLVTLMTDPLFWELRGFDRAQDLAAECEFARAQTAREIEEVCAICREGCEVHPLAVADGRRVHCECLAGEL